MEDNMNAAIGITDILIDTINKKYNNIRDLNSLNVNLEEENYEAMIPVIDSIIDDENNSIGKLQQLIDLLSGSEEDIEEGKQDTIEIIDGNEFVESFNKMKKKLRLSENFDNVIDDVQAVADPVFVGANKEHDENKKKYEDAMEENKKAAEDTIPDEGDTGKEVKSKELKAMHLSEDLFTDYSMARPGTTKVLDLVDEGVADPKEMLYELVRYLPDRVVKEFIDYYAENFLGIFEEESIEESFDKKNLKEGFEGLNWNYWYSLFSMIADEYFPDEDMINTKVDSLYNIFEFEPGMEEAYRRWNESSLEESLKRKNLKEGYYIDDDSIVNENTDEVDATFTVKVSGSDISFKIKPKKELSAEEKKSILRKVKSELKWLAKTGSFGHIYSPVVFGGFEENSPLEEYLNESIQCAIAKEQMKRFNEGKMPKNWNVNSYLKKLVESKHITKKEARSLKEWYSKNK